MPRTLLIVLLLLPATLKAQAPIERRPPAVPTDPAWTLFQDASSDAFNEPIRVRTEGATQHCILSEVTPTGLICHAPVRLFLPRPWDQKIAQTRILKVEREDRSASAGIGVLIGFGVGAGLAASRSQSDPSLNALFAGTLLGGLTSFIAYHVPFIHHTLYRHPAP